MLDGWSLPQCVVFGGRTYKINSDYRDILHLLGWLNGDAAPELTETERWQVALALFYPQYNELPPEFAPDAVRFLADFLQAGRPSPGPGAPRLMDWRQDAALIAAGVAKAAGQDLRTLPYLHWWSFLAWYDCIADGGFAAVVGIRDKLRRGRRLEPWEQDFYRAHRAEVDLRRPENPEAEAEKARLLALLNEGNEVKKTHGYDNF